MAKKAKVFSSLKFDMGVLVKNALKEMDSELNEYARNKIYEIVYDAGFPSEYERTGDFANSIRVKVITSRKGLDVDVSFYHDYSDMTYDRDKFQHESEWGRVENLGEIIEEGTAGNKFGNGYWRSPRPYMDKLKEDLVDSGLLQEMIMRKISW